ncbi:hypothetical protein KJZ99_00190 [bacterium]|nr:hypothetical protein [bacterium]
MSDLERDILNKSGSADQIADRHHVSPSHVRTIANMLGVALPRANTPKLDIVRNLFGADPIGVIQILEQKLGSKKTAKLLTRSTEGEVVFHQQWVFYHTRRNHSHTVTGEQVKITLLALSNPRLSEFIEKL